MKSKYTRIFSSSTKGTPTKYDPTYIPSNDELRVSALKRYKILDTQSEEAFKNITEVVAYTFKVPIALISFVDFDRVFYKDGVGSGLVGKTVDRKNSPCSLAILSDEISQFRYSLENPCIIADENKASEAGYKFYVGAPLTTRDGFNIGMLAIIDKSHREYDENEKRTLKLASQIVMSQIELRLYSLNEIVKLDREIAERNRELQLTLNELKLSQMELDTFLYKASHDLRGPLTSTAGLLNLALREVTDPLALDYVTKIHAINGRMTDILGKLILIYNVIRDTDEFSDQVKSDAQLFHQLIKSVIGSCDQLIQSRRIKISVDIEDTLAYNGNVKLLELILFNLIENAIYFHPGSIDQIAPEVIVLVKSENKKLIISVADNGEGIPSVCHDKIFGMFFKASSMSKTGLGLYIVKKITEKLGGIIVFEANETRGSTFTVELPINQ